MGDDFNIKNPWIIANVAENASTQQLMSADLQLVGNGEWSRNYYAQCTGDLDYSKCPECLIKLVAEVMSFAGRDEHGIILPPVAVSCIRQS